MARWLFMVLEIALCLDGASGWCLADTPVAATPAANASDEDGARAIINRAIQAIGGKDKLDKHKTARIKIKGTVQLKTSVACTRELVYQLPNQFKETAIFALKGKKHTIVRGFDGSRGWMRVNGETHAIDDAVVAEMRESIHLMCVNHLVTLQSKKYKLSQLGDIQVDGHVLVGVKVSSKGYRDVHLYFDKKTGLLAQVERHIFHPLLQREVTEERVLSGYRCVSSIQAPKKIVVYHNGIRFMEAEVMEVKLIKKMKAKEFAQP